MSSKVIVMVSVPDGSVDGGGDATIAVGALNTVVAEAVDTTEVAAVGCMMDENSIDSVLVGDSTKEPATLLWSDVD